MTAPLKVGILGVAHVHTSAYARVLGDRTDAALIGVYDDDPDRGAAFAGTIAAPFVGFAEDLAREADALVVCSENVHHARLVEIAAAAGKPVLVEKPIGISEADFATIARAAERVTVMTAFPCRFSPAYRALKRRIDAGEIGRVVGIAATNRGMCPGGWFVDAALSGGGAAIDHTVHVADLLRDLLGEQPVDVRAERSNRMYGRDTDDCAMLTLGYPSGVYATLDASWSRPANFRIWGDVTLRVTGEKGVIEADLFGTGIHAGGSLASIGSDLDALMVAEFLRAVREGNPEVTAADGIAAARVALAAMAK